MNGPAESSPNGKEVAMHAIVWLLSAVWRHEAWPQIKPVLRRALEMRRQIVRDGW
jgi:hypothetical protein